MPSSLTGFEDDLRKLIAKFENDKAYYLSKEYSEAQARLEFIDPFFRALGWDAGNQPRLPHESGFIGERVIRKAFGPGESTRRLLPSFDTCGNNLQWQ